MNNEFEKMWKDTIVADLGQYPEECLQRVTKSTKKQSIRISGLRAEN
jgi:hypothetical protein